MARKQREKEAEIERRMQQRESGDTTRQPEQPERGNFLTSIICLF